VTRTVVVSGGAGAIGAAVMETFRKAGDRVMGLDMVSAVGVVECDVTSADDLRAAFDEIRGEGGPVDVLVNSAGVTGAGSILDEDPDTWRHILEVNLTGAYLCCREALADMIGSGGGSIVNVASVNARFGGSALSGPAYAASKGGLVTLTRFLAREHAGDGVRANAVAPGPHDTPMWRDLEETRRQGILATLPGGGIGDPGDLAAVIQFLCSDQAGYINGATIDINGGQWMG
jgi:NAD(P)-dependent dehydrogenase (short-subunit alcohol dehydrogenase family)